MLNLTGKANINIARYRAALEERVNAAKSAMGANLSEHMIDEIKSRIPKGGGWLKIYRDALTYHEDLKDQRLSKWTVLGETTVTLTTVPAEESLAFFDGATDIARVLKGYSPFPIDTIPRLQGGISADLTIKPADASEVDTHRRRHAAAQTQIMADITAKGGRVLPDKVPVVNGKIVADLKFMAKRLEFGLGGFPRVPHWKPAVSAATQHGPGWVKNNPKTIKKIANAFDPGVPPP